MFPVSFVILTDGQVDSRVAEMIDHIEYQHIPEYQIIIVGGLTSTLLDRANVEHIPFDESISTRPWLTRKKNMAAQYVKHDVTVWMHDYHNLCPTWYKNMVEFGLDWDIQMNCIILSNGRRMFDWLVIDYPNLPSHYALPYERSDLTEYQYISGGYWVSKKNVMLEEPLNESLRHHQAEDVEWSKRVLPKFKYVMNKNAVVYHSKEHRECAFVDAREFAHRNYTGWE